MKPTLPLVKIGLAVASVVVAVLILSSCRTKAPFDVMYRPGSKLQLDSLLPPPESLSLMERMFPPKVKLKGATVNINVQNASHGSTIGASSQSGADESKTKKSATSDAETVNTGGQGAKVEGSSTATATNTPGSGNSWLKWVALAFAAGFILRHFGPTLVRLLKPV